MKSLRHIRLLLLALSMLSCVKEQRRNCPCILSVSISERECGRSAGDIGLRVLSDDGLTLGSAYSSGYGRPSYSWKVPKGMVHVFAAEGIEKCSLDRGRITAGTGQEFDRIYACVHLVDARGETATDTVHLAKQFSVLQIQVLGQLGANTLSVRLNAAARGFSAMDLRPVDGGFRIEKGLDGDGIANIILPRQCNPGLDLDIYQGKVLVKSIEIGQDLLRAGMDWNKTDLDDASITVDCAKMSAEINVIPWNGGESGEKTI